jgi:hypothetical protein
MVEAMAAAALEAFGHKSFGKDGFVRLELNMKDLLALPLALALCYSSQAEASHVQSLCFALRAMKITVELNPEDLAAITEQVMKVAGPEAISKIWMAVGDQIAEQIHAQMLAQMPEAFRPFFKMRPKQASGKKT